MAFVLFLTLQRALNHLLYYNPTEKPVFLSTSKGNQGFVFLKKKQIWHQTQDNTKLSSTKLQFPRIKKSHCFFQKSFPYSRIAIPKAQNYFPLCPSYKLEFGLRRAEVVNKCNGHTTKLKPIFRKKIYILTQTHKIIYRRKKKRTFFWFQHPVSCITLRVFPRNKTSVSVQIIIFRRIFYVSRDDTKHFGNLALNHSTFYENSLKSKYVNGSILAITRPFGCLWEVVTHLK